MTHPEGPVVHDPYTLPADDNVNPYAFCVDLDGQWFLQKGSLAPDDDVADMYVQSMERLERAGFEQYEISNVARPGRCSRHNLKYWQDGEWLGMGPGAHSTRAGVRWRNEASTSEYIASVHAGTLREVERRELTPEARIQEALFTGLRLNDGLSLADVRARYDADVWSRYGPALQPFVDGGWLIYDGGTLRLSRAGMLVAHDIMTVFLA